MPGLRVFCPATLCAVLVEGQVLQAFQSQAVRPRNGSPLYRLSHLEKIVLFLEILDPRMIEYFDQWQSLICFVYQNFVNKVFILIRQTGLESDLPTHNLVTDFSWMHSSKWRTTVHKLIQQDTQGPNI